MHVRGICGQTMSDVVNVSVSHRLPLLCEAFALYVYLHIYVYLGRLSDCTHLASLHTLL